MKRTRRHHGAAFKTQVAFTAVKGEKTLAELATQFGVAAVQYTDDELLHRAVQEALVSYGNPDIFNTDQGCQFTSQEFTGLPNDHGIQICMGGTGCWRDNVFLERLWRSVPYICRPMTASAPPVRAWGGT